MFCATSRTAPAASLTETAACVTETKKPPSHSLFLHNVKDLSSYQGWRMSHSQIAEFFQHCLKLLLAPGPQLPPFSSYCAVILRLPFKTHSIFSFIHNSRISLTGSTRDFHNLRCEQTCPLISSLLPVESKALIF